ncbi:hypothetical protein OSTOST_16066 [Ostertagia ostertagi]
MFEIVSDCKRWNSKPFFYPNSPPLPQSRTEPARPFLHVGIDLAGPFRVLSSENKEQKKWILLATCMVTRAVHLDIVNNLSAKEFINGLRRFVARRGKPTLRMADQGAADNNGEPEDVPMEPGEDDENREQQRQGSRTTSPTTTPPRAPRQ